MIYCDDVCMSFNFPLFLLSFALPPAHILAFYIWFSFFSLPLFLSFFFTFFRCDLSQFVCVCVFGVSNRFICKQILSWVNILNRICAKLLQQICFECAMDRSKCAGSVYFIVFVCIIFFSFFIFAFSFFFFFILVGAFLFAFFSIMLMYLTPQWMWVCELNVYNSFQYNR